MPSNLRASYVAASRVHALPSHLPLGEFDVMNPGKVPSSHAPTASARTPLIYGWWLRSMSLGTRAGAMPRMDACCCTRMAELGATTLDADRRCTQRRPAGADRRNHRPRMHTQQPNRREVYARF